MEGVTQNPRVPIKLLLFWCYSIIFTSYVPEGSSSSSSPPPIYYSGPIFHCTLLHTLPFPFDTVQLTIGYF
jgi:hypothetical protein